MKQAITKKTLEAVKSSAQWLGDHSITFGYSVTLLVNEYEKMLQIAVEANEILRQKNPDYLTPKEKHLKELLDHLA